MFLNINLYMLIKKYLLHLIILYLFKILSFIHITHLYSLIKMSNNFIFVSTDKAVNPTNAMGTTKLMGERLMTAANSNRRGNGPIFASTRFGNVLGSSGSVIPIFRAQIEQDGPVTLTDKDMTRFVMSVKEAVELVLNSVAEAKGG